MAENIENQTCSVCLEQFSEPKILPCCHTFCLKCLEKPVGNSEEKDEIICPQCCKTHAIPTGGLRDFVTDFSVVHAAKTVSDLTVSKVHYCSTHTSEILKMYCDTCKKPVCRECYVVDHHQHSYKSVEDARKQLSDQLTSLVEDGSQKLAAFKNNLEQIQKVETTAARYPEVLKAEINAFFDGVIQSIEKRRQQLLARTDTECHKDLKLIWADKVFHQATIPEAEDALRFADKATKCTSDVEMILTALQSIRQLSQLQAIEWDASILMNIGPFPWKLQRTELTEVGGIERASTGYSVKVENFTKTAELGKPLTFKIVAPTFVDERSQRKICLIKKAEVLVTYGESKKLLSTVSVSLEKSDGSSVVTMRPVCGGKHTIEVKYGSKPVRDNLVSLDVKGKPNKGDRVRKGPDWEDNNLHVKEGTVQSVSYYSLYTSKVDILWDDIDGAHKYIWSSCQVELV